MKSIAALLLLVIVAGSQAYILPYGLPAAVIQTNLGLPTAALDLGPYPYGPAALALAAGHPAAISIPAVHHHALAGPASYVAANRGSVHAAPLPGHLISQKSLNLAPAPGTL
ncbi:adult cuticle protein 1-like [Culex pipiens pallens]|uniref:adult cuticle protein 1-like n=1 Tax=Culex pipiens pallens TaxID=42434 RepID=UPI001954F210|nr:adult cuticle protein 1-like [Culex pipiens pallens]